jgi:uncharacterized membrane protein YcaP (DUF421 family)
MSIAPFLPGLLPLADATTLTQSMWDISLVHWWEFILRAVIVYLFLLVILRLTGKRQIGQLAPFDLVMLLVLSNAVQNAMNGGDNSITGGVILVCTLISINYAVSWLTFRSKRMAALIEGRPLMLVHNGHVDLRAMRKVQLTMHELDAALRAEGCCNVDEVHFAMLENNGHITVVAKK